MTTLTIIAIVIAAIALQISVLSLRTSTQKMCTLWVEPLQGYTTNTKAENPKAEEMLTIERAYKDGVTEVTTDGKEET